MPKYSTQILEEELKNKVAADWFAAYDTTQIVGKIDFAVAVPQKNGPEMFDPEFFLWAEAKRGIRTDIAPLIAQLVLTVGKARTFNHQMPPLFLGAFDAEKIAFVPYLSVSDIFYMNDFNWNVTPSNYETREFALVLDRVREQLAKKDNLWIYDFEKDEKELRRFIKLNFIVSSGKVNKVRITPNNFAAIFNRWSEQVAPTIAVDWEKYKKDYGIIQADFFYADIFSKDNESLADSLKVLLNRSEYRLTEQIQGRIFQETFTFRDRQQAHLTFWNRYQRPPQNKYRKLLLDRRDLLVPPDVRERKGAFFTPSQWVDLSQQYLADYLGEDWQERYYIWDCCAGTGNLLHGLYNKYNIYASTLDDADVHVMKTQQNLLDGHVFQFDFLNDDLQGEKVPESLRRILADPEERKKLVIYINPPYAEHSNIKQTSNTGQNRLHLANDTKIYDKMVREGLGSAARELFAQFYYRVAKEISSSILAVFSKLKILQAQNFSLLRESINAKLDRFFMVPADTFDNVKGHFPIGFFIYDQRLNEQVDGATGSVIGKDGSFLYFKQIYIPKRQDLIINWLRQYYDKAGTELGYLRIIGPDIQNNKGEFITNQPSPNDIKKCHVVKITPHNVKYIAIYLAMRQVVEATWANDRDQYLSPQDSWQTDYEFHSDCLAYTLFHGQNRISATGGTNHWLPFTEEEVGAKERFDSHFMSDFLKGKIRQEATPQQQDLFGETAPQLSIVNCPLSIQAQAVMDAGRELWKYYHSTINSQFSTVNSQLVNASFYDIRRHFQGVKVTGKGKEMMNTDSADATYTQLLATLRQALKALAKKIEPKVYEHGFLKS